MDKIINDPAVLAEFEAVFLEYEKALTTNDVPELDRLFWDSPHTLRYGAGENLYGFAEIQAFRNARPAVNLDRTITRRSLTTFGDDVGVANIEFSRQGSDKIGRQSQNWIKFSDGWKVVAAHVSLISPP